MIKLTNKAEAISYLKGSAREAATKKIQVLRPQLQEIAEESVEDLQAVDTGLLKSRTKARILSSSKSIIIEFNTNNIEYAQYVYYGLGTNRKYGARKFNLISALKAKQIFESGKYTRILGKGGAKRINDLQKGKKKNILQRRTRKNKK
jgi:hypothetical protein